MKEKIIEMVTSNDKIQPKRCSENYIKKNNLDIHNYINDWSPHYNFKESLKLILTDNDGLCPVCDGYLKMKGNGSFPITCSPQCSAKHRTQGVQPHKVNIPKSELEYLYNVAKLQPSIIGELYDTTNVTVMARMDEYGIEKRSHSEQQILHVNREVDVWNYNGFDREKANDIEFLVEENKTKTLAQIASEIGCKCGTIRNTFIRHGVTNNKLLQTSFPEQLLIDFIESLDINYEYRNYSILGNLELDIYLPDYNLAIECNGIYWHSDKFVDSNYHANKTNRCNEQGIQLLHFWDFEIIDKYDIVKSIIKAKLNIKNNIIYASDCIIKKIDDTEIVNFMDTNHIQGSDCSDMNIGVYHNDTLVSAAMFIKSEQYTYELVRFANIIDTIVIDGLMNIVSGIDGSIISMVDMRLSKGYVHKHSGFVLSHISEPTELYVNSRTCHITTNKELYTDKCFRTWDCGIMIFVKK